MPKADQLQGLRASLLGPVAGLAEGAAADTPPHANPAARRHSSPPAAAAQAPSGSGGRPSPPSQGPGPCGGAAAAAGPAGGHGGSSPDSEAGWWCALGSEPMAVGGPEAQDAGEAGEAWSGAGRAQVAALPLAWRGECLPHCAGEAALYGFRV
jgi:hypothetical protein